MKFFLTIFLTLTLLSSCRQNTQDEPLKPLAETVTYTEAFRPQYHFTPQEKWMNDPNGLVYHQGVYHLFYQYYPDDIVWGPMHWGHAVSKDMLHWEHKPIALYPDKNGYIFSGSAVVDTQNTTGFGTPENPPLVAIFTYHDDAKAKAGRHDFQTQGIAYSLDNGDTWTVYEDNPVIGNTDIHDFRDPKVFWHEDTQRWIMALVAGDHAKFYASDNLKTWTHLSDFGKDKGAHGGVWECPDLFKLPVEGTDEEKWVLFISINPGAPHGGSGTQYFVGSFDGTTFTTDQTTEKWIDWGTDNYAGVTYNNTPDSKRLFIGWMSNWLYAQETPSETWRSAMTLPRELSLTKVNGQYALQSKVFIDVEKNSDSVFSRDAIPLDQNGQFNLVSSSLGTSEISFRIPNQDVEIFFSNDEGDTLAVTYQKDKRIFSLDRSRSGMVNFNEAFGQKHSTSVSLLTSDSVNFQIFLDWSSIEIFLNDGLYSFTEIVFPKSPFNKLSIISDKNVKLTHFSVKNIHTIW
ncbi:MAG: glycoside hydrolase family 32 protein [Bacteroidetes bacterium]|nr:glycoside hydrolase family 32 protein [Bacteroidota bacterium]